jgi:hypothetical protein
VDTGAFSNRAPGNAPGGSAPSVTSNVPRFSRTGILKNDKKMKHVIIIFTFVLIPLSGFCDTLDYWHVYLNDKLIAEFNENSTNLMINIKKVELKGNAIVTVRYGSDHPCVDCHYGLTILGDFKRKAPEVETNEHFGKLSIPLKDLLDIQKTDGINKFSFNYYERTNIRYDKKKRLLFVLTIT